MTIPETLKVARPLPALDLISFSLLGTPGWIFGTSSNSAKSGGQTGASFLFLGGVREGWKLGCSCSFFLWGNLYPERSAMTYVAAKMMIE